MAEQREGLLKRLGRGFDRYIGGLLGEDLEGMTPEEKAAARRSIIGVIGRGMIDPAQGSEALGAVTQARAMQRAQAEVARRTAAAEAEMPRITGRLLGGTAGALESLPGGEGGPLTARYRQAPQEALARLYGTQAGRDVAQMAPDLAKLATESVTGVTVGGSRLYPLTGQFVKEPEVEVETLTPQQVAALSPEMRGAIIQKFPGGRLELVSQPPRVAVGRGAGGAAGGGAPSEGGGGLPSPAWGKEDATTLRKEATGLLSEYQKFGDAWGRVREAALNPSAANDIALIFAYMKILDPASAVREGEFATAANAGSIPQRVWARYNNLLRGERLNPEQRSDFLSSAYGLVRSQHANAQRVVERYHDLARGYNLPTAAVAQNPLSWAIAPKVKNDEDFNKLPPGTLFEDPNGRLRVKPR